MVDDKWRGGFPLSAVRGIDSAQVFRPSLEHYGHIKVEVRSTPHLAKNERDVGHPRVRGRDGSKKEESRDTCCFLYDKI